MWKTNPKPKGDAMHTHLLLLESIFCLYFPRTRVPTAHTSTRPSLLSAAQGHSRHGIVATRSATRNSSILFTGWRGHSCPYPMKIATSRIRIDFYYLLQPVVFNHIRLYQTPKVEFCLWAYRRVC